MTLTFNVPGSQRKELAKSIGSLIDKEVKYCGAPSFAYQIGRYLLAKDGTLTWSDLDEEHPELVEENIRLIHSLEAAGYRSAEAISYEDQFASQSEPDADDLGLTISMPRDTFTADQLENLKKLVCAKASLLRDALMVDELPITVSDEVISFPWFTHELDPESCKAYTDLITAMCKMAKEVKWVSAKDKEATNPKYEFRCFLLRLGFIGDRYKATRNILLKNLPGSAAFKGGAQHAVSK